MGKLRAKPGEVYEIPLSDGSFGYVKCLPFGEYSFLDCQSDKSVEDVEFLQGVDSLFRVWVMNYAFDNKSAWRKIGVLDLTDKEMQASPFFKQDQLSGRLTIYQEATESPKGYEERPATFGECLGLERAAVWKPEHIVDRLVDHFEGRENKWVRSLALKP